MQSRPARAHFSRVSARTAAGATSPAAARVRWVLAAAIALLAIAAYLPALNGDWIWDDDSYVTANVLVQSRSGLADIWTLARDPASGALVPHTPQYYPLVFTTFWVEHALYGLEPLGYHVTNLLLHLANAWLVWRLLARLGVPGAACAAALFALHPMNVESVAWITERKNVLSGLCYLLAFLAFLRFDDTRRPRWWLLALLAFVGALLSKSVTATLPIAIGAALFWRHRRLGWKEIGPLLPFVVLGVLSGAFTAHLEQVKVGAQGAEFAQSAAERWVLIAPRAYWHYALHALWPHPILFVYPRWDPHWGDAAGWIAAGGVLALVAVLFALRPRLGWGPILAVFVSAVTLAPALGFVPVYPHRYSWVADHFAYLGIVPLLALAAAGGAILLGAAPRARIAAAAIVLLACTAQTHRAARSYDGLERLWTDTLAGNPGAWIARISLGIEWMKRADRTPELERRALEMFETAALDPMARDQAFTNQGLWHLGHGDLPRAEAAFRSALSADATHARARDGLATTLLRRAVALGSTRAALEVITQAQRELGPELRLVQIEAWILATSPDAGVRDGARARRLAEALVQRLPGDFGALDTLAAACAESGDFVAAVQRADAALRLAPPAAQAQVRARLELYRSQQPFRAAPPAPATPRSD